MNIKDRIITAARAFRAAPQLAARIEHGIDERPETLHYQDLYAKSGAVYSCIKRRADAYSRPVLRVYRTKDGKAEELLEHPLRKLLDRVNPFWTRIQLWRQMETDLLWHGNALWALESLGKQHPVELWRMRPDWVRVVPDKQLYIKGYLYQVDGIDYAFTPMEVIHYRYANPLNEYWGLSPLSAARYAAELGIDAVQFNRNFFLNASTAATALISKVALTKTQADDLTRRWEEAFVGVSRAHKTAVLSPDLSVEKLTINQRDAEWMNAMKWTLSEVARVYGVPEPLVGEEKAVYKSIKEAEGALWHETLIPELLWIEEILNTELVPLFGDSSLSVSFDLTMIEAIQDDVNMLIERYAKLLDRGVVTINEVRRKERLGADVKWGNVAWMPMNLMPAGSAPPPTQSEAQKRAEVALREATKGIDAAKGIVTLPGYKTGDLELKQVRQMNYELSDEMENFLVDFFEKESKAIASAYSRTIRQMSYDWDRWRALEKPIAKATRQQAEESAEKAFREIDVMSDFDQENIRAAEWAQNNAAEKVTAITDETRKGIHSVVTKGVENGWARDKIANEIINNQNFSLYRARLIARTETQRAFNQGNLMGYKESGKVNGKSWLNMGGEACPVCTMNSDAEVIGLNELFPSGHDAPPAHPNCRCRILPDVSTGVPTLPSKGELPPFKTHGYIDPAAQARIENTFLNLPTKSRQGLMRVDLYEKSKTISIMRRRYKLLGEYDIQKQQMLLYDVNKKTVDTLAYTTQHEMGHHVYHNWLSATQKFDFHAAMSADKNVGVSSYAQFSLQRGIDAGRNEQFAELHRIFCAGVKADMDAAFLKAPNTYKEFEKIFRYLKEEVT